MKYCKLFSKGKIGKLTIKNRIVMTAAGCGLVNADGTFPESICAYYEARAKGGVGAVVTEVVRVNSDTGIMNPHQINATEDKYIPEIKKLANRLHNYDCKLFLQLQHPGNVTNPQFLNGNTPISPSGRPSLMLNQPIRTPSIEEIKGLVGDFGDAALRAKLAEVDGVEIHAAHFYLIHQFLSPFFNKRTDEYGGSHENRVRFLKEIIEDVKKKCGDDYPVIVRVSVEEFLPAGGYHLDEGIRICRDLKDFGVAAIDVTAGGAGCRYGQSLEPISYKQGWRKHLGTAVKKMVDIPVIAVALTRDPSFAEQLLDEGRFDFVGSARSHLADPEWSNKAAAGKDADIRQCISCLRCIEGIHQGKTIACAINPLCGRETQFSDIPTNGDGRLVAVIGGGPAGMEAARISALRGFEVVLFERSEYLGGQVFLAAQAPNKGKMAKYIESSERQLEKLGVTIKRSMEITSDTLESLKPYAVIDASGAVPIVPKAFADNTGFVTTPDMILAGEISPEGENIVIVGSGMTGLETAEYLIERNNMVTIIEMEDKVAKAAYPTLISDIVPVLEKANTVIMTSTRLNSIEDGYITLENMTDGTVGVLPADRVILSMGVRPQNELSNRLVDTFERVYTVGDAVQSGRIIDAVSGAFDAAMRL